MTVDEALAAGQDRFLDQDEVKRLVETSGGDINTNLDRIAIEVAERYLRRTASFMAADTVMNNLFHYAARHSDLPSTFMRVYEAFDQGEWLHPGDPSGTDPEAAYTKPMLRALVAEGLLSDPSRERK